MVFRKPLFIVVGGISLLALVLTVALSAVTVNRDLVGELVPVSVIVEVPVGALSQPSTSGDVGIDVSITKDQSDFLLYNVSVVGVQVAMVDVIELDPEVLLIYREISSQRSLSEIADGASRLVIAIESRAFRPDGAPPFRAQVIALDADGNAIASDWRDPVLVKQIDVLSSAVVAEGISWVEAMSALIDAGRDRELERESDNPLGQRILDLVSP